MMSSSSTLSIRSYDENLEETCGCEVGCGNKRKRFPISCLQCFASPKYALLFLCFASIGQGFLTSGLLSVVISTLERRFHLHSTETGFIASSYDIASCLSVLLITYIGGRGHKPFWIGWGIFIMGVGSLVFTLPHFFAPTYSFGTEEHSLCNSTLSHPKCFPSNLKSYMIFFVVGQLLHGTGGTTLFTLGVTYLDENVSQLQSSLYHGVYYSSSVVGPALGFLLGGTFLTVYTDINKSVDITEKSSLWIGAWWLGFLIGGVVVIVMSFPILLFPKQLPNTAHVRLGRETEMYGDRVAEVVAEDKMFGKRFSDIWKSVLVLLRNPTFLLITLAGSLDSGLVIGLTTFGPKYLESMFAITPTQAATYFGVLAILAGASGQLIGGVVVTKAKLTVPGILKMCAICSTLTSLTIFVFFSQCPDILFAGATVPYVNTTTSDISAYSHFAPCNLPCTCNPDLFDPVCGSDNVTYYSPCYAGCQKMDTGNEFYSNCACIVGNASSAIPGKCPIGVCNSLPVFLTVFFFSIFGTFLPSTPAIQAVLRVVPFTQRSFAIGVKFVILRLLGSIPGPIIFGKVLDLACIVWSSECGKVGACELYKNEELASRMAALIAVVKVMVVVLFILSWFVYKPPQRTAMDSLDEITLTGAMAHNTLGLPTAHGVDGGLGEAIARRFANTTHSNISYNALKDEIDYEM